MGSPGPGDKVFAVMMRTVGAVPEAGYMRVKLTGLKACILLPEFG